MLATPLIPFCEVIVIQYFFSVLQLHQITYSSSSLKKPSLVKVSLSLTLSLSLSLSLSARINRELQLDAPNADLEEAVEEAEQVLQRFNPSQLKGKTKGSPVMGFEFDHLVCLPSGNLPLSLVKPTRK